MQPFFLVGPTAVGKSELVVELAQICGGEIVGADAFQVYAGLDVLTAKPPPALRARVKHHLVGEISLNHLFNVAEYSAEAQRRITDIHGRGKQVFVAGGTGLYVRALTRGLAQLPAAKPELRRELETQPLGELVARLKCLDPVAAARIDVNNRRRLVRALEVCILTGHPFSSFQTQWPSPPIASRGVVLIRDRDDLYARIHRRTLAMFDEGVVKEVASVRDIGTTAAQAIGYREIQSLLSGAISEEQCISAICQATRRYAKRQETWFRRETDFVSMNLTQLSARQALEQIRNVFGGGMNQARFTEL
jgi:tRNA dimethylallyltransferase